MIILKCIYEHSKLRIKFHCFINDENVVYTNVYNNNYNCTFPRDIRKSGAYYKVNDGDIKVAGLETKKPYYSIKRSNITVMTEQEVNRIINPAPAINLAGMTIYDAGECVVCLSAESEYVFIPCAHSCICGACNDRLKLGKYDCPVCRKKIEQAIFRSGNLLREPTVPRTPPFGEVINW
jgi:hypothetical protein